MEFTFALNYMIVTMRGINKMIKTYLYNQFEKRTDMVLLQLVGIQNKSLLLSGIIFMSLSLLAESRFTVHGRITDAPNRTIA